MQSVPETRGTVSAPPAPPVPIHRPHPRPRPGGGNALLEARLVSRTALEVVVTLESASRRGFVHTLRVDRTGHAEHVADSYSLPCLAATFRHDCHHMRDAVAVAAAYQAYATLRTIQRLEGFGDPAMPEDLFLEAQLAYQHATELGYALRKPEGVTA